MRKLYRRAWVVRAHISDVQLCPGPNLLRMVHLDLVPKKQFPDSLDMLQYTAVDFVSLLVEYPHRLDAARRRLNQLLVLAPVTMIKLCTH